MDEFVGLKVDSNGNLTREYREWLMDKKDRVALSKQAREEASVRDLTKEEHDTLASSDLPLEDKSAISKEIRALPPEQPVQPIPEVTTVKPTSPSVKKGEPIVEQPKLRMPIAEEFDDGSSSFDLETDLDKLNEENLTKDEMEKRTDTPTQKYYNAQSSTPWKTPEFEAQASDKMKKASDMLEAMPKSNKNYGRLVDSLIRFSNALGSSVGGGAGFKDMPDGAGLTKLIGTMEDEEADALKLVSDNKDKARKEALDNEDRTYRRSVDNKKLLMDEKKFLQGRR